MVESGAEVSLAFWVNVSGKMIESWSEKFDQMKGFTNTVFAKTALDI